MVGTVTLSLELELAWGLHDLQSATKYRALSADRREETRALKRLLDVCDRFSIPMSFGIVGHLFLENCRGKHDGPYPAGWFDEDPGSNVEFAPHFYAPDLIRAIREASIDHEICTHTYSHVLCDEVPPELVRLDLTRAQEQHDVANLSVPDTLLPPRHRLPERSLLRDMGIEAVRVPIHAPPKTTVSTVRQKARSFLRILGRSHPITSPTVTDGVLETYTSLEPSLTAPFLPDGEKPPHPIFRGVPLETRQSIQERYLREGVDRAVERESYAHFWSHLFNLANDVQWVPIRGFLEDLARRRNHGEVTIKPIRDLKA